MYVYQPQALTTSPKHTVSPPSPGTYIASRRQCDCKIRPTRNFHDGFIHSRVQNFCKALHLPGLIIVKRIEDSVAIEVVMTVLVVFCSRG